MYNKSFNVILNIMKNKRVYILTIIVLLSISLFGCRKSIKSFTEEKKQQITKSYKHVLDNFLSVTIGITAEEEANNPDFYYCYNFNVSEVPESVHDLKAYIDAIPLNPDYTHYLYFKCTPKDISNIIETLKLEKDSLPIAYAGYPPEWWAPEKLNNATTYSYYEEMHYSCALYVNGQMTEAYYQFMTY